MNIVAIFCLMVLFYSFPVFAGSTVANDPSFVPTKVENHLIPLQLKGGAGKNEATIKAALADFEGNCAYIRIITYEVQLNRGNVTGLKVRYAQS